MRLWQASPRIRPTREDWKRTPPSALGVSVLALLAAGLISLMWPDSVREYAGFVWILALIPVFLLSYYRGWTGAAAAAAGGMVALTFFEVIIHRWLAFQANWVVVGGATGVLIPVTIGAGWLSDRLIGARSEERKLHERAPVPMLVHQGGEIRYANRAAIDLLDLGGPSEVRDRSLAELIHPEDRERFRRRIQTLQEAPEFRNPGRERYRIVRLDGKERSVEIDSLPVLYGTDRAVQCIVHDVTERARMEEALERLALYDSLTDLPNRHLFEDRLEMALSRAQRQGSAVGVLFLDLDGFKAVNDRLGHAMGDRVLARVARRMEENIREEDTAARYGGDEFTILMEDVEGAHQVRDAGQRLRRAVGRAVEIGGQSFSLDASIGMTVWGPGRGRPRPAPDTLVRRADVAMLRAKEEGGGRLHLFDPRTDSEQTRRLRWETRLRDALEEDAFRLDFQPILDLEDGRLVGLEPLARWERDDREIVAPADFIPVAEDSGLIVELGETLLRQACRQLKAWEERWPWARGVRLHPNLSGRELDEPEVLRRIQSVVDGADLAMDRIAFELTESAVLESSSTLTALRNAGARVVVDDFGTGATSITHARDLPIDGLKLDLSLVRRLGQDPTADAIVELILDLGRILELDVIAEGVEREEQARRLSEMGCGLAQGRHFSPALPPEELERWLEERAERAS